jgi:ABC-type antimicrobial peptide transport system permease subunit
MMEQYIELIALALVLIFSVLIYEIVSKMKKEMKDFTWNQYFVKCGIYQGESHWTIIKSYLLRPHR